MSFDDKPPSPWTDTITAHVIKLWREGRSATQIMNEINIRYSTSFSRSAVIGKIHRTGNSGRTKVTKRKSPRKKAPASPVAIENQPPQNYSWWTRPKPPASRRKPVFTPNHGQAYDEARRPHLRSFIDLEDHHCKWPIGDTRDPDFGFCAAARVEGQPYCQHHIHRSISEPVLPAPTTKTAAREPESV